MSVAFAGVFDPGAREPLRLAGAQGPPPATICSLDGFLDEIPGDRGSRAAPDVAERLLTAYRRWGAALPARLRGDFALLLWDAQEQEGLLARDQLGVRCFYLHERNGRLTFATELHLLRALLPSTPGPDRASVAHWVAGSARPGSQTLYEGVRRLDPGTMLLLDRDGARERTYWRPRYRDPPAQEPEEAADRLRGALGRAVRARLDPDAPTGILMSGGLDSASVAAVAVDEAPGSVRAYAGVFPDHAGVDESGLIALLREQLSLPGVQASVRPGGLVAGASRFAAGCTIPQLGWGDCWTLPLLEAASRDGVRVLLGGDGGDELFGARTGLLADTLRAGRPRQAMALARELPGAGDRPPRREVIRVLARLGIADALPGALGAARARVVNRRNMPDWLLPGTARALLATDDPRAWTSLDGPRWWKQLAHGVTRGVEERGIFEHQRLRSSQAGLWARHPLFDLDLLELMLATAPRMSFDRHRDRPLLRAAMRGVLPEAIRLRAGKAWFDALVIDGLTVADRVAVRALLTCDPELGSYVDSAAIARILDAGPPSGSGRFAWMHHVWRLVSLECWLRWLASRRLPDAPAAPVHLSPAERSPHALSTVFQP